MTKLASLNGASTAVNQAAAKAQLGQKAQLLIGQLYASLKTDFVSSVTLAFAVGMVMMILAFVAVLFLREIPLQGRQPAAKISEEIGEAAPETIPDFAL